MPPDSLKSIPLDRLARTLRGEGILERAGILEDHGTIEKQRLLRRCMLLSHRVRPLTAHIGPIKLFTNQKNQL